MPLTSNHQPGFSLSILRQPLVPLINNGTTTLCPPCGKECAGLFKTKHILEIVTAEGKVVLIIRAQILGQRVITILACHYRTASTQGSVCIMCFRFLLLGDTASRLPLVDHRGIVHCTYEGIERAWTHLVKTFQSHVMMNRLHNKPVLQFVSDTNSSIAPSLISSVPEIGAAGHTPLNFDGIAIDEICPVPGFVTDGRTVWTNVSMCEAMGDPQEESTHHHWSAWLDAVHSEDADSVFSFMRKGLEEEGRLGSGILRTIEFRLVNKQTRTAHMFKWQVIFTTHLAYGSGFDINEQNELIHAREATHRAEEALKQAKEEALQAVTAKARFLAMISHELRTPMNGILGMAQVLSNGQNLTSEQLDHVKGITSSLTQLQGVVEKILNISDLEHGTLALHNENVDIHAIVNKVLVSTRANAEEKNIQITVTPGVDIPPLVQCDSTHLHKILLNIVENAIKFTNPRGSVTITYNATRLPPEQQSGDHSYQLTFKIKDTGIGISSENMDTLFAPFSQVDQSTSRKAGGAGLGLSIVSELAKLMGGSLKVSSDGLGKGSEFTLTLGAGTPILRESSGIGKWATNQYAAMSSSPSLFLRCTSSTQDACSQTELESCDQGNQNHQANTEKVENAKEVPRTDPPPPLHESTISVLIVDDTRINCVILKRLLKTLGHEADVATGGQIAIDMSATKFYDIIFMDCRMPGIDGYEATRRIMQREGPKPYIVAVTAEASKDECLQAGMREFMSKPVHSGKLKAMLDRILHY